MKTRFLTAVVTLALGATMLGGCGRSQEPSPANEVSTGPAVYADEVEEEPEPAISVDEPATSSGLAEVAGENDDFGRPPEDECVEWEEEEGGEEEKVQENNKAEGIIMLQVDWTSLSVIDCAIYAVNPSTNASQEIGHFRFDSFFTENNPEYIIVPAWWRFGCYKNLYDQFSSDYTKAAATKTISSSGEVHAGWINESGNFFDVTEALNEQAQSDFDAPATYYAVGIQDDVFIYVDETSNQFYGIAIEDIESGSSWEISAADSLICEDCNAWNWLQGYKLTDWIDDGKALVEKDHVCRMAIVSTQTLEEYLPGESSRYNWSAVASPDGTQVAFLSRPQNGNETNVYTIPLSGGDPIKLEPDFAPWFKPQTADQPSTGMACCYILEWR